MNRKIVIINNSCPYGGETFLLNELKYVPNDSQIIMFPIMSRENIIGEKEVASQCRVCNLSTTAKWYDIIKSIFMGLIIVISKEWKAARAKKGFIRNIAKALRFTILSETKIASISRILQKNEQGYLFYSYWMYECAYIGTRLKKMYPNSFFISRCHGYDLYEERHTNGYLPYRNYIIANADVIFPISKNGKKYLINHYKQLNIERVHIARLGTYELSEHYERKKSNEFTIVSCSNMVSVKRLGYLINVLGKCKSQIRWIHIGNGQLYDVLYRQAMELPCNILWEFRGSLPNIEVLRLYNRESISMFINVSLSEGVPVSIMEAFSAFIPVLATDVGGTGELVHNEENGWLIPKDTSEEELANLLDLIVLSKPCKLESMGKNAHKTWLEFCDGSKNYKDFYRILSLLEEK